MINKEAFSMEKNDMIKKVIELEKKVFEFEGEEQLWEDLKSWFDIEKFDNEDLPELFSQYLEDLEGYLQDYSEGELMERIEGLKTHIDNIPEEQKVLRKL